MGRTLKKGQKNPVGRPKGKPRSLAEKAADARRTGRPALPDKERGTKMLSLRLTPTEYDLLTNDAKKAGMDL